MQARKRVVATYHPSAVLRAREARRQELFGFLVADWWRAAKIID